MENDSILFVPQAAGMLKDKPIQHLVIGHTHAHMFIQTHTHTPDKMTVWPHTHTSCSVLQHRVCVCVGACVILCAMLSRRYYGDITK